MTVTKRPCLLSGPHGPEKKNKPTFKFTILNLRLLLRLLFKVETKSYFVNRNSKIFLGFKFTAPDNSPVYQSIYPCCRIFLSSFRCGQRNNQVATQNGPVNVGIPMGAKKVSIPAWMKTVAKIPNKAQMAVRQLT